MQTTNDKTRDVLATLEGEKYVSLETFKKSGVGVKTAVWFAAAGDALYFFTNGESWKVKRLRNNPACKIAACTVSGKVTGPWFDGTCELLEGDGAQVAYKALRGKYGVQMMVADVGSKLIGSNAKRLFYRIDV